MKQILFTDVNKAELADVECPALRSGYVKVKTEVSTLSCGTERANITGDVNISIFEAPTDKPVFPRSSGYSSSGVIAEVADDVTDLKVGDRVCMFESKHVEYNVLPAKNVVKLPDSVSFSEGALAYICTFSLAACRKTDLEIGESLMVMGLGILGLFAVRFAHLAGAIPVIACDPVKERREKALKFGADYALDPLDKDFTEKVKEITGTGVNTAIEVTGKGEGLVETLECMAPFGRVALLGCTRDKNFTIDYYRLVHGKGVKLIGAHNLARPKCESSSGMFTTVDDIGTVLKFCEHKRAKIAEMIDETYSPNECAEVYDRLVFDKNFPTVVQFDWKKLK